MKIKNMSMEELEQLSYTDLAYLVLKEGDKALKIPDLFKKVCTILKYSDDEYMAKIGDFYTAVNTDKRFVNITDGLWDIRDRHSVKLEIEEESDDEEEPVEDSNPEEMAMDTEGKSDDDADETDDTDETDLDNLTIVDDEEDDLGE
jgi:DNA-directed RNA polymerase subunit delta